MVVEAPPRRFSRTWSTPVTLSAPSAAAPSPHVAVDGRGDAVAVWSQLLASGDFVLQSASRPARGSWSPAVTIGAFRAAIFGAAGVGISGKGEALAVWSDIDRVEWATRPLNGAWSSPRVLRTVTSDGPMRGPVRVAVNREGDAIAVWAADDGAVVATTKS